MKLLRYLTMTLCVIAIVNLTSCSGTKTIDSIVYTELGIPTSERYSEGVTARSPWDMATYENKLYIGSGDYDTNAGPVDMWCYDIDKKTWSNSGTVPEEEIDRFCVIDNKLVVPGIDPQEDWSLGNYYV